ncbi:glutathione S-transferase [Shewanella sp. AS16]|uniref:glutathione S-transferase n=1 Tax=Shewanella sp. AS16 TaxID=2907625 RepID=UPI001F1F5CEA|nr:glutathione S-transferase [Shewanella sp. AS16]MCE9687528.1 glutathione S-transferase [Shewanella sp. AS16]
MKPSPQTLPILYSFRRCPYAMRARMGILLSGQQVMLREILLKHKPEAMLQASPKGTVPVLVLPQAKVIDESLDIMRWALNLADPLGVLPHNPEQQALSETLLECNDREFKAWLDKYKYADRHPQHPQSHYRAQGLAFIARLEQALERQTFLICDRPTLADYGIFPFVRQFAGVDSHWFVQVPYPKVQLWLAGLLQSRVFIQAMAKFPNWLETHTECRFPAEL